MRTERRTPSIRDVEACRQLVGRQLPLVRLADAPGGILGKALAEPGQLRRGPRDVQHAVLDDVGVDPFDRTHVDDFVDG